VRVRRLALHHYVLLVVSTIFGPSTSTGIAEWWGVAAYCVRLSTYRWKQVSLLLTNPRDLLHYDKRCCKQRWTLECDKLATKLSSQRLRRWRFRIKRVIFNISHLHLVPPLGVTLFEFCRDLRSPKIRVGYRVALFAWSYTFSRFSRTPTCDRRTDGHITAAHTTLAWRRVTKNGEKGFCGSFMGHFKEIGAAKLLTASG